MWPFARKATREELLGLKRVTINGMRFVIRKINPYIDFPDDRMPQIFTSFVSRRPEPAGGREYTDAEIKKSRDDMMAVVRAGVVEPKLSDAEDGITAADLFRDPGMGTRLYIEILAHSLNRFRGIRGLFFFRKTKLLLWMQLLKGMDELRRKSFLATAR